MEWSLELNQAWIREEETQGESMNVVNFVNIVYLSMNKGSDGQIPSSVGGHSQPKEGPNPVVVEWRYEHSGGTASSKDICPCPLVQMVVNVVYITV